MNNGTSVSEYVLTGESENFMTNHKIKGKHLWEYRAVYRPSYSFFIIHFSFMIAVYVVGCSSVYAALKALYICLTASSLSPFTSPQTVRWFSLPEMSRTLPPNA